MATTASFLDILRYFTSEEQSPLDAIHWEKRDAVILGKDGAPVFEACGIEVPAFWSQRATDIVTSKYFRVVDSARETSVQRMIIRVVNTICWWGYADGYFDAETVKVFADELTHLLVHQYASFNSPVWFNVGVAEHPQSSACFVLDVEDSMESILEWYRQEGMIFKHGSGAGVNLSKIRAKGSSLSGGGKASGVMSFARVADTNAGAIKSGGTTRRAAKLLVLDVEHPEIEAFIQCKADAEKLARNLRQLGYSNGLEQGVTDMIPWQNANNSVNVSHEFMELATAYSALLQPDIRISEQVLLHKIAKAAWECGCPGLFFGETINTWHTTPTRGPIVSANPCMEVLQPPNTACNLASLNLLKFLKDDNTFDIPAFTHAIDIMITAMDILVDRSSYPTEAITKNSREYRPLGLGYANLGALLMSKGLPYDSNEGRGYAAAITALMTGEAYAQSARLAGIRGAFAGFEANQEEMQHVLHAHSQAVSAHFTGKESHHAQILTAAYNKWGDAAKVGEQYGYRNCQVSVLAPTGCLTPDALIPTDKGLLRLENMGNTEGAKWQDVDCAVMTDEGAQHATQFFVNGTNNVVQVTTTRGYQLCSTPVHRIKVFQDGEMIWKHASDLVSGDIVPLHLMQHHGEIQCVSLPDFPLSYHISENGQAPRVMSKELAEFIGAFMANGSWHEKGLRLHISTSDPDVAERIVSLARSLFDLDAHIEEHRDSACVTVCVNSTRLARWWYVCGFNKKQHGVARGKGYIAHIPDAILRTNDCAIYASFVRGVFDHDGTVQEGVPSFSNKDRHFVRDMQTLLLYLGYPTTLKRDIGGISGKPVYVVRLLNYTFVPSWKDEVGFYGERKSNLLSTKQKTYGKYDIIPITRELLNVVVPLQHPLRHDCTRHLRENQGLPRILAQRINDECPHPHLTFLLQFFYDTVEEVVLLDDRLTYDLSVPSNATYIANGFISHNTISFMMDCDTTGIEPCLGLVATKKLVGGGEVTLANQAVGRAMETLGYTGIGALAYFLEHPEENAGTWHILEKHRDVFACALSGELASGLRWDAISWQGHIKMVAAVQPFISGGISKCVAGDTLLATNNGLLRIGEIYGGESPDTFRSLSEISVPKPGGTADVAAFYYGGIKPLWKVTLTDGRTLTGTATHRVRLAGEDALVWQYLPRLQPGDFVAVHRGAELWGNRPLPHIALSSFYGSQHKTFKYPQDCSYDVGLFLGMLTADGHVTSSNYIVGLTKSCPEVLARFTYLLEALFGVYGRKYVDSRNGVTQVQVGSKSLQEWLAGIGFSKEHIPTCVLTGSRAMAVGYLSGLYLDGWVVARQIAIGQKHRTLLLDVQALWDNLGVPTYFTKNVVNGIDYPVLQTGGGFKKHVAALLEWLEPHKAYATTQLCADRDTRLFPLHKHALVARIRELGLTQRYRSCFDPRTRTFFKKTVLRIADDIGFDIPQEERCYDYIPVASVEYAGEEEVFDIAVPETETFVGNGIVNHNTVNMPHESTEQDVFDAYSMAWKMGLKAVAIYRDGSKIVQPVTVRVQQQGFSSNGKEPLKGTHANMPVRHRLPNERQSITHKFSLSGHEGYVTVGFYPDGTPGELFVRMAKEGSTLGGLLDSWATLFSIALQHGIPLENFTTKLKGARYAPAGFTINKEIPMAQSITDYIARWLDLMFGTKKQAENVQELLHVTPYTQASAALVADSSAPSCGECGSLMLTRNGSCFVCLNCGTSAGCS